jgi:polar amino acid transport system substrate-binding protein
MRLTFYAVLAVLLLSACGLPRDNAGTLERVRNGEMRVGVTARPPWVRLEDGRLAGIEPALLKAWAGMLGARIRWIHGSEGELVEALHRHEIDILAAGLKQDTPYKSRLGLSQPYIVTQLGIAVPADQRPPEDWKGRRVAVDPARVALVARVRAQDAEPVFPAVSPGARLPVAVYDFELAAHQLLLAETLAKEKHVLAVSQGESAFLFALDHFLQALGEEQLKRIAAEEASR